MVKHVRTLSFLFVLFIFNFASAQNSSLKKVNLSVSQKSIRELLTSIQQQTQLRFSFNSRLIDQDSIVSYRCKNKAVKHVIADLSANRLTSKRIGNHIILVENERTLEKQQKKKRAEQRTLSFSGFIIHARTNTPIEKASIYDAYTRATVMSDNLGRFKISAVSVGGRKTYVISKKGYKDTIVYMNTSRQDVKIRLMPIPEKITKLEKKETSFVTVQQRSDFLYGIVPMEALITSENLRNVYENRVSQVSFLPKVGTNWMSSGVVSNSLSLNVLGGYNGNLNGVEIGGLVNILNQNATGTQIAGLANIVTENVTGAQIAGLLNKNGGRVIGAQISGLASLVSGKISGAQISGLLNSVTDTVTGIQIGGLANITKKEIRGLQIAGTMNINRENVSGVQVAGIANILATKTTGLQIGGLLNNQKSFSGVQISGIANIVSENSHGAQITGLFNWNKSNLNGIQVSGFTNLADTLRGVQITGFYNKTKVNKGVQISIVNVADEADGVAIGLFNYIKKGYRTLEVSANEMFFSNLTFKMGSQHFYNIYKVSFQPTETQVYAVGLGFGTNISLSQKLSVSFDATTSIFSEKIQKLNENTNNRLDVTLNFQPKERIYFTLGPSFNVNIFSEDDTKSNFSSLISPFYSTTDNRTELNLGGCFAVGYRF